MKLIIADGKLLVLGVLFLTEKCGVKYIDYK